MNSVFNRKAFSTISYLSSCCGLHFKIRKKNAGSWNVMVYFLFSHECTFFLLLLISHLDLAGWDPWVLVFCGSFPWWSFIAKPRKALCLTIFIYCAFGEIAPWLSEKVLCEVVYALFYLYSCFHSNFSFIFKIFIHVWGHWPRADLEACIGLSWGERLKIWSRNCDVLQKTLQASGKK